MMRKAVPLAVLLGSAAALDNFVTGPASWAAGTTATATSDATAAGYCCYYTGTVTTDASNNIIGTATGATTTNGPCAAYNTANAFTGTPTTTNTIALTSPTTSAQTSVVGPFSTGASVSYNAGSTDASAQTSADGTVLTVRLSPNGNNGGGTTAGNTNICKQTMTRTFTAPSSDFVGTWTVAAGTGTAASCCFLDTSANLVVATASSKTSTSTAKFGSNAACTAANGNAAGGAYNYVLAQGTSASIAQTLLTNPDTFTLSTDKNTITYSPKGAAACTQTLTKVQSSSGVHLASIMTPAVVGGAMLGLMAL